jgi:NADH:ubiquinone oxidoreductase subunit 3 (subunit A)
MFSDLAIVFMFVVFGLIFVVVNILLSRVLTWLLNIRRHDPRKGASYECGENPIGDARIRFNSRFYLVALVFLIFDVEALLLIPIAVVYKQHALVAFFAAGIFVSVLVLGLAYDWTKGDLDWVKPKPRFGPKGETS